jgi:transposase
VKGQIVLVPRKRKCERHPDHPTILVPTRKPAERSLIDLAFTTTGCRKSVFRLIGKRGRCPHCGEMYVPPAFKQMKGKVYGPGFIIWVVYLRMVLRLSYRLITQATRDLFGVDVSREGLGHFVRKSAEAHLQTEQLLQDRILQNPAIHVDETKLSILGSHHYVWVLTDGKHVIFRLTEGRETGFLNSFLADYRGVLVSDFYGAYDALPCLQQKCLVHLIRDLNDDLWKNPFNVELETFIVSVRDLLLPILSDAQRFGLKAFHLRKHCHRVDGFYKSAIDDHSSGQELIIKYQKRFERYRESLFTFLERDGIPWNNNAAERALRHLAVQRKISGAFSSSGAQDYIRLLGVAQSCRFQEKSFLGFLRSGLQDVDTYKEARCRRRRSSSATHATAPPKNQTAEKQSS